MDFFDKVILLFWRYAVRIFFCGFNSIGGVEFSGFVDKVALGILGEDSLGFWRYFLEIVGFSAKGVCLSVFVFFSVYNFKIKLRKEFCLSDLSFI